MDDSRIDTLIYTWRAAINLIERARRFAPVIPGGVLLPPHRTRTVSIPPSISMKRVGNRRVLRVPLRTCGSHEIRVCYNERTIIRILDMRGNDGDGERYA